MPTELLALPNWGDTPAHQAQTDALWAKGGAIGEAIGFRWGGRFQIIKDRPHFEWSGGLRLGDLRGGLKPASQGTSPIEVAAAAKAASAAPSTSSPVHQFTQEKETIMRINLGKLAAVAAQLIVAVPAVMAAVKPVIAATKKTSTTSVKNSQ